MYQRRTSEIRIEQLRKQVVVASFAVERGFHEQPGSCPIADFALKIVAVTETHGIVQTAGRRHRQSLNTGYASNPRQFALMGLSLGSVREITIDRSRIVQRRSDNLTGSDRTGFLPT